GAGNRRGGAQWRAAWRHNRRGWKLRDQGRARSPRPARQRIVCTGGCGWARKTATGISANAQEAKVLVTENGYEPARLTVRAGQPARITFVRTTDKTCGTEVVFPSLNIRRALPLNEPIVIEFTPKTSGESGVGVGMTLLRGNVVVR